MAQSGGRYLDCTLRDEGFYLWGRVIGIISHLTELMEQIPPQIEVVSAKEGSRIVQ